MLRRLRPIDLRAHTVTFDGAPAEVRRIFERKLLDNPGLESSRPGEIVARFSGSAGPLSYRTREVVRLTDEAITFEHLEGPFHSCHERFVLRSEGATSTVCHDGTFTMRWGLAGWLFGLIVVRPLFERLIAGELDRMTGDMGPDTASAAPEGVSPEKDLR